MSVCLVECKVEGGCASADVSRTSYYYEKKKKIPSSVILPISLSSSNNGFLNRYPLIQLKESSKKCFNDIRHALPYSIEYSVS